LGAVGFSPWLSVKEGKSVNKLLKKVLVALGSLAVAAASWLGYYLYNGTASMERFEKEEISTEMDLNGDGILETVRIEVNKEKNRYTLFVNDVKVSGEGEELTGGFVLVDMDKNDSFKEIAVSEYGPSDDPETSFYYYDGGQVKPIGSIYGLAREMEFDGKGGFTAPARGQILQTWFYPKTYRLGESRLLVHVPQELYPMNTKVKVIKPVPLRRDRQKEIFNVILGVGETATILSSDDKEWCLVENSRGVKGWIRIYNYNIIGGLNKPATDYFTGLSNAD
jgi:hypothetical protein